MNILILLAIYLVLDILGLIMLTSDDPDDAGFKNWSYRLYADGIIFISIVVFIIFRVLKSNPDTEWFKIEYSYEHIFLFAIIGLILIAEIIILCRHYDLLSQSKWVDLKYSKELIHRDEDLPAATSLLSGHILHILGILAFVGFNIWSSYVFQKELVNKYNIAIILSVAFYISVLLSVRGLRMANFMLRIIQNTGICAMTLSLYYSFLV